MPLHVFAVLTPVIQTFSAVIIHRREAPETGHSFNRLQSRSGLVSNAFRCQGVGVLIV